MIRNFFFIGSFGMLLSCIAPLSADLCNDEEDTCTQDFSSSYANSANFESSRSSYEYTSSSSCNDSCDDSLLEGKLTIGTDWLYWTTYQENFSFARFIYIPDLTDPNNVKSSTLRPKPKYENGYRVNIGYQPSEDSWGLDVIYTDLPSHAKVALNVSSEPGEVINLLKNSFGLSKRPNKVLTYDFTQVRAKWSLNVSYLDLDLSRTLCCGECLRLRPHIGARFFWMDQKFRLGGLMSGVGDSIVDLFSKLREDLTGYGIQGGFSSDWNLFGGFSIVGHVGGSILYSKFSIKTKIIQDLISAEGNRSNLEKIRFDDSFWSGTPSFDYFIGLQYFDSICDTSLKVHVGWEQHILFNANQFNNGGNLSLQGLTLNVAISF